MNPFAFLLDLKQTSRMYQLLTTPSYKHSQVSSKAKLQAIASVFVSFQRK